MGTNGEIWPIKGQETGDHDQTMTDSLWHGIIESLYKNFAEEKLFWRSIMLYSFNIVVLTLKPTNLTLFLSYIVIFRKNDLMVLCNL